MAVCDKIVAFFKNKQLCWDLIHILSNSADLFFVCMCSCVCWCTYMCVCIMEVSDPVPSSIILHLNSEIGSLTKPGAH